MAQKYSLVPGKNYQVMNTKFTNKGGMISCDSTHEFLRSFPCYDARFHGAGNPDDYIVYKFKLPRKLGEVSFYQFEIKEIIEA